MTPWRAAALQAPFVGALLDHWAASVSTVTARAFLVNSLRRGQRGAIVFADGFTMRRTRRNPFMASASAVVKSSSESTGSAGASVTRRAVPLDWRGLGDALGFVLIVDSSKAERRAGALDHRLMAQHPARVRLPRRNVALALSAMYSVTTIGCDRSLR